jgi:pimeloyl-ACP methyl ester carboxylesterase
MAPPYDPQKMTLNYERIGKGSQKIILLHGLTGSLRYWKRGLDSLSDSYSLLLIDLLGFGDSPKPKSKYDLEEHLGAIEKVINMEGFNSGNCIVVGHSLGAILSIGLVGKHPDWFQGVAVIGLPNYHGKEAIKSKFSKSSVWDGISVDSKYKFVCFFHPLYITEWFRPKNIPMDIFKDTGKHTWVSYYRTLDEVIINTDLEALAFKIKNEKILFIHGENDAVAPIENIEELLPQFNKARFERLPEADHQVYLAEPKKIWSLIKTHFFNEEDTFGVILTGKTS